MRVFTIFVNIAISVNCYGRGALPIYDGRLDSDLNANNFSITNLYSLDVKNVPWVTTNQLDAALEGIVTEEHDLIAIAQLDAHKLANNPHDVTPAQIGAITTNQLDTALEGIVTEETDYIALPVINAHLADMDNPHNVTPAQIGAITTNQLDAALEGIVVAESDPVATPIAQDALDKANRLYHYGDINIVPSPDDWFTFSGGEITGFNYVAGREHVVIPYAIGGIQVTSIGELVFSTPDIGEGAPVVSVTAPKTVTSVGSGAFDYCLALTTVSLPSVTSVGIGAFYSCSALTTVSLPSVTSVGNNAFDSCSALTSVSLPMVTSISSGAFFDCSALTAITLGKTRSLTWGAGTVDTATIYVPHDSTEYSDTFYDMPVIRATESADNFYLGGKTLEDRFDLKANVNDVAAGTNWLYRAGLTGTVAFANAGNRPQAWSGSGNLIVTEISGLASPSQVYWTLQGFDSITLPAGIYAVGGGTWQAGMVNHFALWQVAGKTMITFLTATEIE